MLTELSKYLRVFAEVVNKKNALFPFTLNVTFFAVGASNCDSSETSHESRLSPLHTQLALSSPAEAVHFCYRAMLYTVRTMLSQDVCHSVCLSHATTASKRLNIPLLFPLRGEKSLKICLARTPFLF